MLNTKLFGEELKKYGFDFYSGVPCSFLKDLINYAINNCEYVMAANEGDAIAICAGAHLGGKKSVVLMQNSGLTNTISPLTSLNYIFKIPVLGFVSLRGEEGLSDEPQHELMGKITASMLDMLQIKWDYLSGNLDDANIQIKVANEYIENGQSFFFVVRKGIFDKEKLHCGNHRIMTPNQNRNIKRRDDTFPKRIEVLEKINSLKDKNTILMATTGNTGRELYEIEDAPNNLYMVGSMGCVGSIALGLSLVKKDFDIIAIDGDGSLLMRMGSLATNSYYRPENMMHIVLDNNSYDSTGGQKTVSHNVNFVDLAASVGYDHSIYVHDINELEYYIKNWKKNKGLTFIYVKIAEGSKENLGRPKIKPYEVKERLMEYINRK